MPRSIEYSKGRTKRICHSERSEESKNLLTLHVKGAPHPRFFTAFRMTNPLGFVALAVSFLNRGLSSQRHPKHLSIIILTIFLLVCQSLTACDGSPTPKQPPATPTLSADPLTRGSASYDRGEYFSAIKELTEALEADPDNLEALYRRAWSYLSTNDYELGYADLDRMVKVAPNDARGHYGRGWAQYLRSQQSMDPTPLQSALADMDRAIRLKPDYPQAYSDRGTIHYALGQTDQAMSDYNKALELDPNYTFAYFNRGVLHRELGDVDKALADFNRLIELDPDDAEAYYNRANAYSFTGDKARALADYKKALELARDPDLKRDVQEEMRALESAP